MVKELQISHLDGLHGYFDSIVKQSHSHGCDNGQPLIDMKNLCEQNCMMSMKNVREATLRVVLVHQVDKSHKTLYCGET